MKPMSSLTAAAVALALGAATIAGAQGRPAQAPPRRHTPVTPKSSASSSTAPKSTGSDAFKGIANKLGTTPDALESQYQTAKQANPKLTRGQFVAANVIAQNLSSKNPNITTAAILSGLQSGKSIGQTLQSLGLSEKDATDAQHQANRDIKAARSSAAADTSAMKPKP